MAPIYEDLTSPPQSPEIQEAIPTAMSSTGIYFQSWQAHLNNQAVNINFSDVEASEDISERFITLQSPQFQVAIGRGSPADIDIAPKENNLFFASKVVSRHHARITADPISKHIFIRDQGSMHGTFVGGKRLGLERVELHPHDIITFGQQVVRGADTFEPLRLAVEFEWFNKSSTEKAKLQPSAQASGNTFTFDYSDVEDDDAELTDEEPEFVSAQRVSSVIEIDDDELPKGAESSVETSPQSKKSDELIDSPSTSTSSVVQAEYKDTTTPGLLDFSSVHATEGSKLEQAEGQDEETDADEDNTPMVRRCRITGSYNESEGEDAGSICDYDDEEEDEAGYPSQPPATAVPSASTFQSSITGQAIANLTSSIPQAPYQAVPQASWKPSSSSMQMTTEPSYSSTRAFGYERPPIFQNPRPHSPSDVALPVPNFAANLTNFAQPPPLPTMAPRPTYLTANAAIQGHNAYTHRPFEDLSVDRCGRVLSQQDMLSDVGYQNGPSNPRSSFFNDTANHFPHGFIPALSREARRALVSKADSTRALYGSESDVVSDTDGSNAPASPKVQNSTKRKFDDFDVAKQFCVNLDFSALENAVPLLNNHTSAFENKVHADAGSDEANNESERVEPEAQATATTAQVEGTTSQIEETQESVAPTTAIAAGEVVQVESNESEMPPRKKARIHSPAESSRPSLGKQLVKNTAMVLTGAAIGAVGTVFTLASLPADYFV